MIDGPQSDCNRPERRFDLTVEQIEGVLRNVGVFRGNPAERRILANHLVGERFDQRVADMLYFEFGHVRRMNNPGKGIADCLRDGSWKELVADFMQERTHLRAAGLLPEQQKAPKERERDRRQGNGVDPDLENGLVRTHQDEADWLGVSLRHFYRIRWEQSMVRCLMTRDRMHEVPAEERWADGFDWILWVGRLHDRSREDVVDAVHRYCATDDQARARGEAARRLVAFEINPAELLSRWDPAERRRRSRERRKACSAPT